jgi:gamma-glutamylcysteine synthetase
MDYAEKVLQELICKFENMDQTEYEQIYQSAMEKLRRKTDQPGFVFVEKPQKASKEKDIKNFQYPAAANRVELIDTYDDSAFERDRQWAA